MDYEWNYFVEDLMDTMKDQETKLNGEVWKSLCCPLPDKVKKEMRIHLTLWFRGYREASGECKQALIHLLTIHTELCHIMPWDNLLKRRHNALIYRYVVDTVAGNRAVARKLTISKDTLYVDLNHAMNDILILCAGLPYLMQEGQEERKKVAKLTIKYYPLLAREKQTQQWLCLFPDRIRSHIQTASTVTEHFIGLFNRAIEIYTGFNRLEGEAITNRRIDILRRMLNGHTGVAQAVAAEYGCGVETVYLDIRENQTCLCDLLSIMIKSE